jgi:diaminohydroxyphosphoribosylaminopyrimidine deaminase/5-amino-6-(5-phosphoribosylamino)uracil reductase
MGISTQDRLYMEKALKLAVRAKGCTSPNPMVGALIVQDGKIIGRGYHKKAGLPHAEIEAIRNARGKVKGATLYVTLEPCDHQGRTPPCTQAIIEHGVARVVAAMVDPNPLVAGKGLRRLREAGIEVDCGVLEGEAKRLNEAFITHHILKRPFVVAKWAMTLDGRTSTDTGDSRWISNDESRRYAHEIRSCVDAVAVGIGTVFFDNPRLTVRLEGFKREQPKRVIFDGRLRTPTKAKCLEPGGEVILLTTSLARPERVEQFRKAGHKVLIVPGQTRIINVAEALRILYDEGIQSILVEGGRQLHTALLRGKLVDKLVVFLGQHIVGGETQTNPVIGLGVDRMKNAIELKNMTFRNFGPNVCIEGYLNPSPALPVVKDF